jgi:hypothetical protein
MDLSLVQNVLGFNRVVALSQKSIAAEAHFVFSSCEFVDRCPFPENKGDPRNDTNQHELRTFQTIGNL